MQVPLMLLPGLMNDARVWDPLRPYLAGGRHVEVTDTHTADSMAALAAAAISAMPPGRFAVAGFSLGGYVALEVCEQARERVAGIALLDTGARADSEEATRNRQRMLEALDSGAANLAQVARSFATRLMHLSQAGNEGLLALLADMAQTVGSDGFARQQTAAMNRPDRRQTLSALHCPALVLCGRDDQITPPGLSEEMSELLEGHVELVLVDQCGHMATLEQPSIVGKAVGRWLERCDAASRD